MKASDLMEISPRFYQEIVVYIREQVFNRTSDINEYDYKKFLNDECDVVFAKDKVAIIVPYKENDKFIKLNAMWFSNKFMEKCFEYKYKKTR